MNADVALLSHSFCFQRNMTVGPVITGMTFTQSTRIVFSKTDTGCSRSSQSWPLGAAWAMNPTPRCSRIVWTRASTETPVLLLIPTVTFLAPLPHIGFWRWDTWYMKAKMLCWLTMYLDVFVCGRSYKLERCETMIISNKTFREQSCLVARDRLYFGEFWGKSTIRIWGLDWVSYWSISSIRISPIHRFDLMKTFCAIPNSEDCATLAELYIVW